MLENPVARADPADMLLALGPVVLGLLPLDRTPREARPAMRAISGSAFPSGIDQRAATALLAAVNRERAASGRAPLIFDDRLAALARDHALDMAARRYFSHDTPEGLSPFDRMVRADYRFEYAGENIALDSDEAQAERGLWGSPEHRDNTLRPQFARVGVAAVRTADGELFVEDFSD